MERFWLIRQRGAEGRGDIRVMVGEPAAYPRCFQARVSHHGATFKDKQLLTKTTHPKSQFSYPLNMGVLRENLCRHGESRRTGASLAPLMSVH